MAPVIFLAATGVAAWSLAAAGRAPAGPAFARLRDATGTVHIGRAADGAEAPALLNQPLLPGDCVRTADGRAEIEMADASVVWIDRDSTVAFRDLAAPLDRPGAADVIDLAQGSLQIATSEPAASEVVARVDSAAASVYLLSGGLFRVEARRGLTTLISLGGLAEFSGEEGSVLVRSGQRSVAPQGSAPTEPRRQGADRRDAFEEYVLDRVDRYAGSGGGVDRGALPPPIEPYVGELARYGSWQKLPALGMVWRPHQSAGWGPFQRGRWAMSPAGWFWISGEPWGWAPYRFGRWEQRLGLGWVWVPGGNWGAAWVEFAVGADQIGWCPLNFWNQPVFQGASTPAGATAAGIASVGRLDPRAWTFVPIERFARSTTPQGTTRTDRAPRASDLVLTRQLPDFEPARLAETAGALARLVSSSRDVGTQGAAGTGDAKPVSFLVEEQSARTAGGSGAGVRRRGSVAIGRVVTPPAHPPRTAQANAEPTVEGHAVERLMEGTHPDPPSRRPATHPSRAGTPPSPATPRTSPRGVGSGSRAPGNPATLPPLPPPGDEPDDDPGR